MIWLNDTVAVDDEIGKVIAIDFKGRYTVQTDSRVIQNLKHRDMKKVKADAE